MVKFPEIASPPAILEEDAIRRVERHVGVLVDVHLTLPDGDGLRIDRECAGEWLGRDDRAGAGLAGNVVQRHRGGIDHEGTAIRSAQIRSVEGEVAGGECSCSVQIDRHVAGQGEGSRCGQIGQRRPLQHKARSRLQGAGIGQQDADAPRVEGDVLTEKVGRRVEGDSAVESMVTFAPETTAPGPIVSWGTMELLTPRADELRGCVRSRARARHPRCRSYRRCRWPAAVSDNSPPRGIAPCWITSAPGFESEGFRSDEDNFGADQRGAGIVDFDIRGIDRDRDGTWNRFGGYRQ